MITLSYSCSLVIPVKQGTYRTFEERSISADLPLEGNIVREGRGVFIEAECGAEVFSVSDGSVIYSGDDIKRYGWLIIVESTDGLMYIYGNLKEGKVFKGETVKKGNILGYAGEDEDGRCGVIYEVRNREGDPLKIN